MLELEGLPLASFAARAAAFALDMAIAAGSYIVPALIAAVVGIKMGWIHDHVHITFDPFHHEHWESVVWVAVFISASNYVGNGATLGKRLLRIRAVSLVHRHLSLWHSIERALGYGASALEAFFGFFQYFLDPNRQTVHDRIAKTIVVAERRPAVPAPAQPPLQSAGEPATADPPPLLPAPALPHLAGPELPEAPTETPAPPVA
jgi:uncharacterized RDD family membrane protein YckC